MTIDQIRLEIFIDTIHMKYRPKIFIDYKELSKLININFGTDYTEGEILSYYESVDERLIYKHCI